MTDRKDEATPSLGAADSSDASLSTIARRFWLLVGLAVIALYVAHLIRPLLLQDDFGILYESWTWDATRANLWRPHNEHIMPVGRVFTFLFTRCVPLSYLPYALGWVGVFGVLVGMGTLYLFVRRELGHPFYGAVAAVLFGVTTIYHQAVTWYSASLSILALDCTLFGLLAAQSWLRTRRPIHLDLCAIWAFVAPAWFASGILTGPLCCLYLFGWERTPSRVGEEPRPPWSKRFALTPLWGTVVFLVVGLALAWGRLQNLEHYRGKSATEAFRPEVGLIYTARSIVDNLLVGQFGATTVELPVVLVGLVWIPLVVVGVWWWRRSPHPRLYLLGLGFIGSAYVLIYSARATWDYSLMTMQNFDRYHLLPQVGLALIVSSGLPSLDGQRFTLSPGGITDGQRRFLRWMLLLLFLIHWPRGILCHLWGNRAELVAVLERIERADTLCREHHISADRAREALPKLPLPEWTAARENGWLFLRGSPTPREYTNEEIRRLLDE